MDQNTRDILTLAIPAITGLGMAYIGWKMAQLKELGHKIEAQTDGISSNLARVTGEAEHAKGVLQGKTEGRLDERGRRYGEDPPPPGVSPKA